MVLWTFIVTGRRTGICIKWNCEKASVALLGVKWGGGTQGARIFSWGGAPIAHPLILAANCEFSNGGHGLLLGARASCGHPRSYAAGKLNN